MEHQEQKSKNIKESTKIDFVDSTRPIPKLSEYLKYQNHAAYRYYRRIVGRRPDFIHYYPHNLFPGLPLTTFPEDWDGMLPSGYFEPFQYKSSFPTITTQMAHVGCLDPVTDILKKKVDWKTILKFRCRSLTQTCAQSIQKQEDMVYSPHTLLKLAVDLHSDPDPEFNSNYNWMYAGNGNIHIINLSGVDYVLHSCLHFLSLSSFSKKGLIIDNELFKYNCGEGNNIFETVYSDINIVAIRLKNNIKILKIEQYSDVINITLIKELSSRKRYTSISFEPTQKNILYVTTLDNRLKIINIDIMKGRTVNLPESSIVDNWSSVIGIKRDQYCHISKEAITVFDKRNNSIVHTWKGLNEISDLGCNQFSVIKKIDEHPYAYIGTSHHLFLTDMRCTKNKEINFLQRWTHQMQCVPTYMSLCRFESIKDLVCLTSQWYEDIMVLPNDSLCFVKGIEPLSISLPYRPPTLSQMLNEARNNMLCLDIYNPIESRLFYSLTGNTVLEYDEKYLVLFQNSLGDIFCQNLYLEHIEYEDMSINKLDEWSKSNKETLRDFEVRRILDISHVWKDLKKVPDSIQLGGGKLFPSEVEYSEEEVMGSFVDDKLDSGLLDVWIDSKENTKNDTSLVINLHFSDSE